MIRRVPFLVLSWLAALAAGCGVGFDPYNQVSELRVLALRADPPALAPGETAVIDALLFEPDNEPISYAWSWCPLQGGVERNYECAVSEADLGAMLAPPGGAPVSVSYDLGTAVTASFAHALDPSFVAAICSQPFAAGVEGTTATLDCTQGLPIAIGLTVRAGDEEVRAFKKIYLAADPAAPRNHNPSVAGLFIGAEEAERDAAVELVEGAPYAAELGTTYSLFAEVPEESGETYAVPPRLGEPAQDKREALSLTWFVQAGLTASMRTAFMDGQSSFEILEENKWLAPQPEEYAASQAAMFLVLRDNRGGVDWLSRAVELVGR